MPGPHRGGHERSLGRGFPAGPLVFKGPVRPAFALALYGGALTRLSRPLGARVIFSRACRPSRTAHLALSSRLPGSKASRSRWVVFHCRLHRARRHGITGSHLRYAPRPGCQRQAAVKLHGDLSPCGGLPAYAPAPCLHGAPGQDSGDLVDPFMRAGTYPARHLATLRESELLPAFSGASPGWTPVSRTASGQDSAPVQTLSGLRGPMFLLNSQAPLGTAACGPRGVPQDRRHPFSRSYGANLPSSLAWVSPHTPWASNPGAPVSVLGTVTGDRSPPPFQGPLESAEGSQGSPIPGFGPFSP